MALTVYELICRVDIRIILAINIIYGITILYDGEVQWQKNKLIFYTENKICIEKGKRFLPEPILEISLNYSIISDTE